MVVQAEFYTAIDQLINLNEDWRDRAARAMAQGGADIVTMFRDEQFSGRNADDSGLNIRTGNLFNSLESDVEVLGSIITSTVENHDAKYWYYHQIGAGHNPKRLTLEERFQDRGLDIYTDHLEAAMAAVFQ